MGKPEGIRREPKLAWVALASPFLGAAVFLPWFMGGDRINQANYEQIHLGTHIKEVSTILGGPGAGFNDEKGAGPTREVIGMQDEGSWVFKADDNEPGRRLLWSGENAVIAVRVARDGRVTDKMLISLKPLTFLERLRAMVEQ
jgi:hypothetical protein